MREVRHALRGSRLAAVLAGVAVLLGTQLVWSTVARRRGGARELRRLRTRLVEGRGEGDAARQESAELIAAADRLVRTAALLHDRAAQACRAAEAAAGCRRVSTSSSRTGSGGLQAAPAR